MYTKNSLGPGPMLWVQGPFYGLIIRDTTHAMGPAGTRKRFALVDFRKAMISVWPLETYLRLTSDTNLRGHEFNYLGTKYLYLSHYL